MLMPSADAVANHAVNATAAKTADKPPKTMTSIFSRRTAYIVSAAAQPNSSPMIQMTCNCIVQKPISIAKNSAKNGEAPRAYHGRD